jgi:hypothetical protein
LDTDVPGASRPEGAQAVQSKFKAATSQVGGDTSGESVLPPPTNVFRKRTKKNIKTGAGGRLKKRSDFGKRHRKKPKNNVPLNSANSASE